MSVECFLDTNVLVYAAAGRGADERKRRIALELIQAADFGISVQVLQEFFVTVTRKIKKPMKPDVALEWVEQFEVFPVIPLDPSIFKQGVIMSERYQISYWDGAILAAAEFLGADTLYSEDLNHGQVYGTTAVVNPFL